MSIQQYILLKESGVILLSYSVCLRIGPPLTKIEQAHFLCFIISKNIYILHKTFNFDLIIHVYQNAYFFFNIATKILLRTYLFD